MPAAPQPPGEASVWQANVQPDFNHPQVQQRLENHLDSSRPWVNNSEVLEHLVPASEREGINEDGISRKLAWLAKNGFTVYPYEELVAAQPPYPPPKLSRKDLRKLAEERKRIEYAKLEQVINHLSRKSPEARKKAKELGPAMVMAPRGEHMRAHQPVPPSLRDDYPALPQDSLHAQAVARHRESTVSLDASTWLDQQQQQYDPAFLPEAAFPPVPDVYGASGSSSTFASEGPYTHAYAQPGYPQSYWGPNPQGGHASNGYPATHGQVSPYPGMDGYSQYAGDMPVSPASQRNDGAYPGHHSQRHW
ncbi:hypothetical protein FRC10_010195 [Ceratobasidium sp. 414]|nr:hypothetical protein FRC10_010195 [Ceratobasidium sp. 414]